MYIAHIYLHFSLANIKKGKGKGAVPPMGLRRGAHLPDVGR